MSNRKPKYIRTELGVEKLCIHCDEYWPKTTEFFYLQTRVRNGKFVEQFTATCKGCYVPRYKPYRLENRNRTNKLKSFHEMGN